MALMPVFDVCAIVLSALLSHRVRLDSWVLPLNERWILVLVVLLSLLLFPKFEIYRTASRGATVWAEARRLVAAWALVLAILAVGLFLNKVGSNFSRIWIGLWFFWAGLAFVFGRLALRVAVRWMKMRGYNVRRAVVVGEGEAAYAVAQRLTSSMWTGADVVGYFSEQTIVKSAIPRLGALYGLAAYVDTNAIDEVWIVMPLREEQELQYVLHELRYSTADIRYVPDMFAFKLLNHSISEIQGLPVIALSTSPMTPMNQMVKRVEDLVLATLILLSITPLLLVIAAVIKRQSSGPIFFTQKRLGWDGKPFMVYKFRTMISAPEPAQYQQATKHDPRITPFGSFLRRTSFDELPQFINVLQGRMSIVGPRPHPIGLNDRYKDQISRYMWRHKVKPGVTGWAQINGWRGETDTVEKMRQRIECDLYYIENWSLWFDLRIIFVTMLKGFTNENAY